MKSLSEMAKSGAAQRKRQLAVALTENKMNLRAFELGMEGQRRRYLKSAVEAKQSGDAGALKTAYSGLRIATAQLRAAQKMRMNVERLESQYQLNDMICSFSSNITEVSRMMSRSAGGLNFGRMQRDYNKAMRPLQGICDGLNLFDEGLELDEGSDFGVSDSELDQMVAGYASPTAPKQNAFQPAQPAQNSASARAGKDGDLDDMLKRLTQMLDK